jgi:hypothetical protein
MEAQNSWNPEGTLLIGPFHFHTSNPQNPEWWKDTQHSQYFWNVTLHHWVSNVQHFEGMQRLRPQGQAVKDKIICNPLKRRELFTQ